MKWWPFGGPEVRESYTDSKIAGLENLAVGGGSRRTAWLSSAVAELAAGQWSRVLSLAAVTPASAAAVVTPDVLATIGRRLARDGESVHVLRFRNGRLRLLEAAHVDVTGGGVDPEDWIYWASLHGPSQTERVRLTAAAVAHVRYGWYSHRSWVGIAPGDFAAAGSGLVGGLDTQLANEALSPSGYLLELPDQGGEHPVDGEDATEDAPDPTAKLRADMAATRGGTSVIQALRGQVDMEDPRQVAPFRIGANPPDVLRWLATEGGARMLAAYGLHPSLILGNVNGQVLRESWRSFLALTARPLARRIEAELTRVLEVPVGLDLAPARAGDVGTLARAVGTLVHNGGLDVAQAMRLVGLEEDDTA